MRALDKLYDGTVSALFEASIAVLVAAAMMSLYVAIGLALPYGELRRAADIEKMVNAAIDKRLKEKEEAQWRNGTERTSPQAPAPQPLSPSSPAAPPSPAPQVAVGSDALCTDGRLNGWDADVLGGASLATCQNGRLVAFICTEGRPYLVTAGPARTTRVRFYSRDGRDRSELDDTLRPREEDGIAVSSLSAETFSYFMNGKSARLTTRDRTTWVDLAGLKRAANQALPA